jgi:hypothetical protein
MYELILYLKLYVKSEKTFQRSFKRLNVEKLVHNVLTFYRIGDRRRTNQRPTSAGEESARRATQAWGRVLVATSMAEAVGYRQRLGVGESSGGGGYGERRSGESSVAWSSLHTVGLASWWEGFPRHP